MTAPPARSITCRRPVDAGVRIYRSRTGTIPLAFFELFAVAVSSVHAAATKQPSAVPRHTLSTACCILVRAGVHKLFALGRETAEKRHEIRNRMARLPSHCPRSCTMRLRKSLALCAGGALAVGFVPACEGLQHSAMWEWDDASQEGNAEFMTLTFDVSNLTLISANAKLGVKALYPHSWTVKQPQKCVRRRLLASETFRSWRAGGDE